MATVRISNQIRYLVEQRIRAMYTTRIKNKTDELQNLGVGEFLWNKNISEKEKIHLEQLQSERQWVATQTSVGVKLNWIDDANGDNHEYFSCYFKPPVPMPFGFNHMSVWFLKPDDEPYKHVVTVFKELKRLKTECETLVASINAVTNRCSTLKQVLELWPTAMDFMPDDVREQHNREQKARTKAADLQEVALSDEVKVALISARLSTGT